MSFSVETTSSHLSGHLHVLWFSATGNSRKAGRALASRLRSALNLPLYTADISSPGAREKEYAFTPADILILSIPTHYGHVPELLLPFLTRQLQGNGALAVPVVTWGGQSYGDTLRVLGKILEQRDFRISAGTAVRAGHAFLCDTPEYSELLDTDALHAFAEQVLNCIREEKFLRAADLPLCQLQIPARPDFSDIRLVTDTALCEGCCMCEGVCPSGAIVREDPTLTSDACIQCHACVCRCPRKARRFVGEGYTKYKETLT